MRAKFLPFSPPSIGEAEIEQVVAAMRTDWITTGPRTKEFEEAFADRVDAECAVAMASCTDALQVALAALAIGPGDAVFTTPMTFCSTVHVIEHLGATPVLVDIDPETLNICPDQLRVAVQRVVADGRYRPQGIIPVHYAGHPCDMARIDEIAAEFSLAIVEDAAHALPAVVDGRTIGDPQAPEGVTRATAFSFYATKNLTTAEGGMLTGPPKFLEEARLWSLHGMSRDAWKRYGQGGSWFYEVVRPGFKCNMTDLQASIGLVQLDRLNGFQASRREIVDLYSSALVGLTGIQVPVERPNVQSALHLYPIRLNLDELTIDRNAFIDAMGDELIGTSVHFIPIHLHPYYADKYGFAPTDFPVALREYQRLVSLPLNNRMTIEDAADVIAAVSSIVERHLR